jgi:hypothetical protein
MAQQQNSSPRWYRNVAIIFSVIGIILVWAAIKQHDWVYGAFAGITLLNAIMSTFKFFRVRESKN